MALRLLKALIVGTVTASVHIATHLVFGDVDEFSEAGVYAAGAAVFLTSTAVSYLLFD